MADLHIVDNLSIQISPVTVRAITLEIRSEGSYKLFIYAEKPALEEDNEGYYNTLKY